MLKVQVPFLSYLLWERGARWTLFFFLGVFLCLLFQPVRLGAAVSQDHFSYIDMMKADETLLASKEQFLFSDHYLRQYFMPWTEKGPLYEQKRVEMFFATYLEKIARREGRKERKLIKNASLSQYPKLNFPAIATDRIDVLGLPYRSKRDGQLNLSLQASSVSRGTPLLISHQSLDEKWYYVETAFVCGWARKKHIVPVSLDFVETWRKYPLVVVVRDGNRYSVGELYPAIRERAEGWDILIPRGGIRKEARMEEAFISHRQAVRFPLSVTYRHLAQIANNLTEQPYGWGGINGFRDCSSLLRDFLSPFGIWLPRHSADQALEGGVFVDLSKMTREEKRNRIITHGIPYLTLLWMKGHIMLYIGTKDGEPFVFHTFRRALIQEEGGQRGEKIVGKSCITTLAGKDAPRDLLASIQGMVFVAREPHI
ncbi:MAG: SH3 domain-containing protein [Syntrophales bacterium]|nr:SH3 domain-containing protein [Syntrophales bacterium]